LRLGSFDEPWESKRECASSIRGTSARLTSEAVQMDRSEKGQPEGLLAEFALLLPHDESRILSPQQLPRVRRERSIEGMVSQFGWLQQAVLAPRPGSRVR